MERVTDDQFALIDGHLRHCPRGVDEYLELLDEHDAVRSGGRSFAEIAGQVSKERPRLRRVPMRPRSIRTKSFAR